MPVFVEPINDVVNVSTPLYGLRYDNKERCFKFGADGFVRNDDGNAILPDCLIVGYERFFGNLRKRDGDTQGTKVDITEEIWSLFWIPVPSEKNKHPLIPIKSLVVTPLVTKAQNNLELYVATIQNSGLAPWQVVTTFKPSKYDTDNRKGVDCLDFVRVDTAKYSAETKKYLGEAANWIKSNAAQVVQDSVPYLFDGQLVHLTGQRLLDNGLIANYLANSQGTTLQLPSHDETESDVINVISTVD